MAVIKSLVFKIIGRYLGDGEGFEPSKRLRVFRFSRPVPSTTRPPILTMNSSGYS